MTKKYFNTALFVFAVLLSLLNTSCSSFSGRPSMSTPSDCMKFVFAQDVESLSANAGTCVYYRTEEGVTPLMMAAAKGYTNVATFLIEKGANVNSVNNVKQNALHFAVVHRQPKMIQLLKQNGAEIKPNNFGITSLMMAIQLGTMEMIELLEPTFEDVNIQADDGWTAVYFAVRRQDPAILDFLLAKGACINYIDDYKQTPIDFAKETGWKEGLAKLKKSGKKCSLK